MKSRWYQTFDFGDIKPSAVAITEEGLVRWIESLGGVSGRPSPKPEPLPEHLLMPFTKCHLLFSIAIQIRRLDG